MYVNSIIGDISNVDYTVNVYELNGNNLGIPLGTSVPVPGSELSPRAYNSFTFNSGVSLSNGNIVTLSRTDSLFDKSNFLILDTKNPGSGTFNVGSYQANGTRNYTQVRDLFFKISGME